MASTKLTKIEKKKQELEGELSRIQEGLDRSIDDVKEEVVESLDPKTIIRKHPLPIFGASLLVGFLLGKPKGKGNGSSSSMSSVLGNEIKKHLTKKAVGIFLDVIDNQVRQKRDSDKA